MLNVIFLDGSSSPKCQSDHVSNKSIKCLAVQKAIMKSEWKAVKMLVRNIEICNYGFYNEIWRNTITTTLYNYQTKNPIEVSVALLFLLIYVSMKNKIYFIILPLPIQPDVIKMNYIRKNDIKHKICAPREYCFKTYLLLFMLILIKILSFIEY